MFCHETSHLIFLFESKEIKQLHGDGLVAVACGKKWSEVDRSVQD